MFKKHQTISFTPFSDVKKVNFTFVIYFLNLHILITKGQLDTWGSEDTFYDI